VPELIYRHGVKNEKIELGQLLKVGRMPMARKIRLVHSHEIKPGESATIDHDGREFVVFNIAGRFYTLPNLCPHIGGPLAGGAVNGHVVICPWHGWQFDITTGQCLTHDRDVASYPTAIDGEWVIAELPE